MGVGAGYWVGFPGRKCHMHVKDLCEDARAMVCLQPCERWRCLGPYGQPVVLHVCALASRRGGRSCRVVFGNTPIQSPWHFSQARGKC